MLMPGRPPHAASALDIMKFFINVLFPRRLNESILPIKNWFLSLWSSLSWMLAQVGPIDTRSSATSQAAGSDAILSESAFCDPLDS